MSKPGTITVTIDDETLRQRIRDMVPKMLAIAWQEGHTAGLNDAQLGEDDDGYADNPYEETRA